MLPEMRIHTLLTLTAVVAVWIGVDPAAAFTGSWSSTGPGSGAVDSGRIPSIPRVPRPPTPPPPATPPQPTPGQDSPMTGAGREPPPSTSRGQPSWGETGRPDFRPGVGRSEETTRGNPPPSGTAPGSAWDSGRERPMRPPNPAYPPPSERGERHPGGTPDRWERPLPGANEHPPVNRAPSGGAGWGGRDRQWPRDFRGGQEGANNPLPAPDYRRPPERTPDWGATNTDGTRGAPSARDGGRPEAPDQAQPLQQSRPPEERREWPATPASRWQESGEGRVPARSGGVSPYPGGGGPYPYTPQGAPAQDRTDQDQAPEERLPPLPYRDFTPVSPWEAEWGGTPASPDPRQANGVAAPAFESAAPRPAAPDEVREQPGQGFPTRERSGAPTSAGDQPPRNDERQ